MNVLPATVTLDFELLGGIILLPAVADGKRGFIAFDTGAMQTALNKVHFPNMRGKVFEIAKFDGEMQRETAEGAVLTSLSLSVIELTDLNVMLMDLSYVEDGLRTFDPALCLLGTLGIDIIQKHSVTLDYDQKRLTLDIDCPFDHSIRLPMHMDTLPIVEIEIEHAVYRFVLDTGANTCLLDHALQERIAVEPIEDVLFSIPQMCVQGREYREVTAVFANISAIQEKVVVDGVIGYSILSPQRSHLDFAHETLYLEESAR